MFFNGSIECTNPCTHTAYCDEVNYSDWPFDAHYCRHRYISRTRSAEELYFNSDQLEMADGYEAQSDNWYLESLKSGTGLIIQHELQNTTLSYVQINFVVRRQGENYVHQVFVPAVVMTSINLVLLCIDPMQYERLVLLAINLFSHKIYLEQLHYM